MSAGNTAGICVDGSQNDFDIKAEFAKLAQRVEALEKDNAAQAVKIGILEREKNKDEQKAVPDIRLKGTDKRRQLADGNMQIAFTAFITPHEYGPLGFEQILKFDHVVTNIGNAYHPHSGTFIVPVDGVYMFFATIAGWRHHIGDNYVRILVNGSRVTEMKSKSDQASQLIILNLKTNDNVHLINRVANDILLGENYSSFSGLLLFAT